MSDKFWRLVFIGLLLRLGLLFLDFSYDLNNHIVWAHDLWLQGYRGFYFIRSSEVFGSPYPNYPPLAIYVFAFLYPWQKIIFQIVWWLNSKLPLFPSNIVLLVESRYFLAGLLKLPAILADIGIAFLVFRIGQRIIPPKNSKNMILVLSAVRDFLFNPVFFYISALMGQIDTVPIFFSLLAIYFLIFKPRPIGSFLAFTVGLLFKPTTIVYLPVYFLFFSRNFGLKKTIISVGLSLIFFWVVFLPFNFYFSWRFPFEIFWSKVLLGLSLKYISNGAFNFWGLASGFRGLATDRLIFNITYQSVAYGLTLLLLLPILWRTYQLKDQTTAFFSGIFFSALTFFLFMTQMHERYAALFLLPLLFLSIRSPLLIRLFYLLSLISFFNIYRVWPVPKIALITPLLDKTGVLLFFSAILVGIYFLLFWIYIYRKIVLK